MEQKRKLIRFRMVPFTIGLFSILACFCGSGDDASLAAGNSYYAATHLMDTDDSIDFKVQTNKAKKDLEKPMGFGFQTSNLQIEGDGASTFRAYKAGTTQVLAQTPFTSSRRNILFQFGTPVTPKSVVLFPSKSERPLITVIHGDWALGNVDVYVTAPNASLVGVTPDAVNVAYGSKATAPDWIHIGANFHVRLCLTGTKNMVADFKPSTNAQAYDQFFYAAAHRGAASTSHSYRLSIQ